MSLTDYAESRVEKEPSYNDGFFAYEDGILYEQNPYDKKSLDHDLWADGWTDAEERDCDVERD